MQILGIYFTILFAVVFIVADILRELSSRWVNSGETEAQDPLTGDQIQKDSSWYEKMYITLITSLTILFVLFLFSLPFLLFFQILSWIQYSGLHFVNFEIMIMASFSIAIGIICSSILLFLPFRVILQAFLYNLHIWLLFPITITIDWLIIHSILAVSPGVEITSGKVSFLLALYANLLNYLFNRADPDESP
ncbi:hypothetical protein [Thermoactinomyces sp. DSM 45892]|uniref:hypothetical protein n=1 Tax=Thermoactinomyces sp. DSM 45892 TaxID=1882753 RepID=UPI00089C626A|nr:hypothetical protein [Thermoactinomyces sp. DSM 45892]SDZ12884.1 hypothetical protein SAMN05444416_11423 [Thermoactinomyces sp. DSM 45892]